MRDPYTLIGNSVDFIIYTIGTIGVHFHVLNRMLKFVKVHIIIGQIIGPAAARSAGPVPTPMQQTSTVSYTFAVV